MSLIQKDGEQVSLGQAFQQLHQTIIREIKSQAESLIKQAKSWTKAVQQWRQDMSLADTAAKLHSQYNAARNLNYETDRYNISRSGNTYSITDKQNNLLLRFRQTPLGREVLENNLGQQHYQDFNLASRTLNKNPELFQSKTQELANLGDLTPQDAVALDQEAKAQQVNDIANKFLHYLGTNKKELKNYEVNLGENNTLTVSAKDERGVILSRTDGVTKVNELSDKDVSRFQNLNTKIEEKYQEIKQRQKEANSAQRTPNRQPEQTK